MEVEVRQPVMERIAAYEMKAAKGPRILIILSYFYTLAASLVSLVLLQKISQYLSPLVQRIPGSVYMMKSAIQGVFVFIVAFLIIMVLYYWQNARKKTGKNRHRCFPSWFRSALERDACQTTETSGQNNQARL